LLLPEASRKSSLSSWSDLPFNLPSSFINYKPPYPLQYTAQRKSHAIPCSPLWSAATLICLTQIPGFDQILYYLFSHHTFAMFKFPKHLVSSIEIPNDKCLTKDLLLHIGGLVYNSNQVHHHSRIVRKIIDHYDSLL
jgi:hypothetical protein